MDARLPVVRSFKPTGEQTSNYVFKKLELNGELDKVLTNPKFHLYTDRFNEKTHEQRAMLGMFRKTYGDDGVATDHWPG
ncbi:hypothetical protein PC128_g23282 [Phytophthora cactorum]|nr:hypothetical protein PC120_g22633 [Phytophthora cactorum]KAG3132100.1 hypothetical protein C6341_g23066 [Phytophthora cactorum]KAG3150137.1 hypothetical protein PC128_g23282 [Phytophthora cactorum]